MVGLGTLMNVGTVILGGALGLLLGSRLPERMRETIMHGLGLLTMVIGIQLSLETGSILIVLGSLLMGGVFGEWLQIERRLEQLGSWVQSRTVRGASSQEPNASDRSSAFSQAFLTASLLFCVGPMTILGSIQDGLTGDYTLLTVKSVLDGFAGLAFASTMGPGVILSALTVLVYQGALTLGAGWASAVLTDPMTAEMTATGGVLMVALGLGLLEIKRVRAGNLLPAVVMAPMIVAIVESLGYLWRGPTP
ncbi:MAG: DUF554 domain-containing protein [Chloroflexi bacterium]|nr:DUF554 domain-containing protein [Chloroflexota bacterium]